MGSSVVATLLALGRVETPFCWKLLGMKYVLLSMIE
jgi:hypothetical protein